MMKSANLVLEVKLFRFQSITLTSMRMYAYMILLHLFFCHTFSVSIVKSLPGFGPLPFKLETGYIGVDENEDVQLFYYFVESEGDVEKDPLVLWLTGGPGCSAISGLAFEIGPLRFNKIEYNGTLPTLALHPYSWTKISSIIFVDAPVGTGFSYSRTPEGSRTGDKLHAHHSLIFLKKWLLLHPNFFKNPFYVAGDSYSGMIVPLIARELIDDNDVGGLQTINFKGYIVGNPSTDPRLDQNSRIPYAFRLAFISERLYKSARLHCRGDYSSNQTYRNPKCSDDLEAISKRIERVSLGHILEPKCKSIWHQPTNYQDSRRELYDKFLEWQHDVTEIPEFKCRTYYDFLCNIWGKDLGVQEALHVRKGVLSNWIRCNISLDYVHDVKSAISYHQYLSRKGCRALVYSGDHDIAVPYLGTLSWINLLNLPFVEEWRPWLVDGQVGGFTTEYSNQFTFATVKGGSHTPPDDMPKECFYMYKRWISEEPL